MKISKLIFATSLLIGVAYAADNNCTDTTIYPTIPGQCSCIITNAVNDCLLNSPVKSICNVKTLSNYFKTDPQGAEAQCEKYRDKSTPDECIWSVTFYVKNC